jgi:hypothetical protein
MRQDAGPWPALHQNRLLIFLEPDLRRVPSIPLFERACRASARLSPQRIGVKDFAGFERELEALSSLGF